MRTPPPKDTPVITHLGIPSRYNGARRYAYIHMPLYTADDRTRSHMRALRRFLGRIQKNRMREPDVTCICNARWVTDHLIRNGAADARLAYPPCNIPDVPPSTADRHGAISVGRLVQSKHHDFCAAVAKTAGVKCTVIGAGNATYADCNIMRNVPYATLVEQMSQAKCVISGAHQEDFGIAVVEAMGYGCIPCVPDAYGFRETVPWDELRYPPQDKKTAARLLGDIVSGVYDSMIPRIHKHVQQFSTDRFHERIRQIIT